MSYNFHRMTIAELKEYANKMGITLSKTGGKKEGIIRALENEMLKSQRELYQGKTVDELKMYAKENGVPISSSFKKADIINAIIAAENDNYVSDNHKKELNGTDPFFYEKPGRSIFKGDYNRQSTEYRFKHELYLICSNCGEEIYASVLTKNDVDDGVFQHPNLKQKIQKCPKCGMKLALDAEQSLQKYSKKDEIPKYISDFKRLKESKDRSFKAARRAEVEAFVRKNQNQDLQPKNKVERELTVDELKQYLLYSIHMESEIYYLTERLTELKLKKQENAQRNARAQLLISNEIEQEFEELSKALASDIRVLKKTIESLEQSVSQDAVQVCFDLEEPVEPVKPQITLPSEPVQPEYKTPSLFNKKKVEAENMALKEQYEEKKAAYDALLSEYEKEQKRYNSELKSYKTLYNRYRYAYRKALEQAENQEKERILAEKKVLLKEKNGELTALNFKKRERIKEILANSPCERIAALLSFEENTIKQELKRIVKARDELYSYGIVYGKYRNYVALTTFYEYLESGRCNSLAGRDGAYNLFETESRANEIVVQLKTIADSLEAIKANQYMLYTEMKQVNDSLGKVNNSIRDVIYELENVSWSIDETNQHLKDLESVGKDILVASNKTAHNSAMTSYYAAEAAHYARVNAEITNALGFLIALK